MVVNAKKLKAIKNAGETSKQIREMEKIQAADHEKLSKTLANADKIFKEKIEYDTYIENEPINLLNELNNQTCELIKQNERLGYLTIVLTPGF